MSREKQNSVVVRIGDDCYDLTNFVERHPGGAMAIAGLAGKNATLMVENHHRNDAKVWKMLKAYRIDKESVSPGIPDLNAKDRSLLELQRKWDTQGRLSLTQACILLGVPALLWIVGACMFTMSSGALAWLGMALHVQGLIQVMVVNHELSHFQVFSSNNTNREWNRWYGILFLGIDGQAFLYDHPVHHVYTNIAHMDSALDAGPIVFHPDHVPSFTPLRLMYESTNRALLILFLSPIHMFRVFLKPISTHFGVQHLPESIRGFVGVAAQMSSYAKFNPAWISPVVILRTAVLAAVMGTGFVVQTMMLASFVGLILIAFSQHYDQEVFSPEDIDENISFMEHMCNTTEDFPVDAVSSFLFFGNQDQHTKHHLLPNVHRWRYYDLQPELDAIMHAHGVHIRERTVVDMFCEAWTFFASGEFNLARLNSPDAENRITEHLDSAHPAEHRNSIAAG